MKNNQGFVTVVSLVIATTVLLLLGVFMGSIVPVISKQQKKKTRMCIE